MSFARSHSRASMSILSHILSLRVTSFLAFFVTFALIISVVGTAIPAVAAPVSLSDESVVNDPVSDGTDAGESVPNGETLNEPV